MSKKTPVPAVLTAANGNASQCLNCLKGRGGVEPRVVRSDPVMYLGGLVCRLPCLPILLQLLSKILNTDTSYSAVHRLSNSIYLLLTL